jgi:signal transduction histidine kinase
MENSGRTAGRVAQAFTLLVSNAIKLGGLYIAVRTAVTEPTPNVVLIAAAMFMMTGAQVTEDQILKAIGRMFGMPEQERKGNGGGKL